MNEADLKSFKRKYGGSSVIEENVSRLIRAVRLLRDALTNCGIVCIQNPPGVRQVIDEAFSQLEEI